MMADVNYQDLWYNLYEYVLAHYHQQNPIKKLMEEMDPSLLEEDEELQNIIKPDGTFREDWEKDIGC